MARDIVTTVEAGPVVQGRRGRRFAWAGVVVALASLVPAARAESEIAYSGSVVAAIDGDTLLVRWSGSLHRVEMDGVDCPEADQSFGPEATALTTNLVGGESIRVNVMGWTAAGHAVARVTLADGQDLAAALVEAGLGWLVPRAESGHSPHLDSMEREARAARRGLWSAPEPVPPLRHRGEPAPAQRESLTSVPVSPPLRRPAPAPPLPTTNPRNCIPRSRCCKVCTTGQACGNTCISARYTCHQGRGCSCDSYEVCG